MAETFIPADRQARIHKLVQEKGIVKVTELSKMFGVTELTIRRDLDVLEEEGVLDRTHGGAVLRHRLRTEPLYTEKDQIHKEEKEAIAKTVNLLVDEEDTLLINTGSTTSKVLRFLSGKTLRIITSNASAVVEVKAPEVELFLTGGYFRSQSNSLIGGFAKETLDRVCGSKAIIGIDGISTTYGLTTPVHEEAEVAQLMIERTQGPVIVAADHSKMGVVSNFVTSPITKVHTLVTDRGITPDFREELEHYNIRVIIAEDFLEQQHFE